MALQDTGLRLQLGWEGADPSGILIGAGLMRKTWLLLIIVVVVVSACVAIVEEITVAAAVDLNYALTELAHRFESTTGNKVTLSFAASGNLYSQIQSGAPFDVFFSADEDYPKKLASAGMVDASSLGTYAVGHLVLWVPNNSPFDPEKLQMGYLPNLLSHGWPSPIRNMLRMEGPLWVALAHFGLKNKVSGKLVMGENISQAAQFVQSGNAQAGLIALSLARSPTMVSAGRYWELPCDAYPELKQAVMIVFASKQQKTVQRFVNYVLSSEGAAVLRKYSLTPPASQ